ncbi:ATP-binding protein [Streptomyces uncialis]|uniref:sensor histidine kinase n=1 Tax=Streptomyces uncialis TaxID=1048205 RepID=UPI00386D1231
MSHLRAPAVRADRREGGRHGRPAGGPARPLPESHIRAQLLRIAVLPAVAVALSATAAVLFTVRASAVPAGPTLWAVLAGAVAVTVTGLVIAAIAADRAAAALGDRLGSLRRASARNRAEILSLVEALRRGETPPTRTAAPRGMADGDEFDRLARELAHTQDASVQAVHRAAQLSGRAGSEQKVEVFVNLARRLQSLVHREISILDELENEVEDPELLKGLFHVDHLATRIRRHAENLAVLGGAVSRRQWSTPVSLHEVLRSAIAEVEQYSRVRLVPPIEGTVRGHAVADVVHLMAELVENATVFSAPHTQVLLRVAPVTSGVAVEVEDRGLGMPPSEQTRMNALLAAPDQVNVASLLQDGRIGLLVVSQLAHRHGIAVRLQSNIYGGVQAVLVLPQELLGSDDDPGSRTRPGGENPPTLRTTSGGPAAPAGQHRAVTAPRPAGDAAVRVPRPAGADAAVRVPRPDQAGPRSLPAADPGGGDHPPRHGDAASGAESPPAPDGPQAAGHTVTHPGTPAADAFTAPPPRPHGSGRPAPLPVRDTRAVRPGPAEAVPGPRPGGATHTPGGVDPDRATYVPEGFRPDRAPTGPGAVRPDRAPAHELPRPDPTASPSGHVRADRAAYPGDNLRPRPAHAAPPADHRTGTGGPVPAAFGTAAALGTGAGVGVGVGLGVGGGVGQGEPSVKGVPGVAGVQGGEGAGGFVEERPTARLAPRSAARGTEDRPDLPKRRAQQHLAPQLREAPGPRRPDAEQPADHDPGLMAAFQRGVGLAEAQQSTRHQDRPPTAAVAPGASPGTSAMPHSLPAPHPAPHTLPAEPTRPGPRRHDGSAPTASAVGSRPRTALDVPAHELPAVTRTPIHDLTVSDFATGTFTAAPGTLPGARTPGRHPHDPPVHDLAARHDPAPGG